MRRPTTLTAFACASALVLALAGCNGSDTTTTTDTGSASGSEAASAQTEDTEEEGVTYSPSEFTIGDFDVTITAADTEYSEWDEQDALVFILEVTNNGDEDEAFGDTLNLSEITQDDEELYWAYQVVDSESGWQYAAAGSYEELEPGASAEYTYAFLLNGYDDPVIVNFDTYSVGVEGGAEVSFDVSNAATEEGLTAATEKAEQLGTTTLEIAAAEVELPDGWYFSYIADNNYSAIANDVDDNYEVDFNRDSNYDDAQTWAEDRATNWDDVTVEERDDGWYVEVGETTWYLYLNTSEGPIEVMGYKLTYDEAADVLAGITIS